MVKRAQQYVYIDVQPKTDDIVTGSQMEWVIKFLLNTSLGCQISDKRVPGSNHALCTFCSDLEQVTFTPCLVLIKARKW